MGILRKTRFTAKETVILIRDGWAVDGDRLHATKGKAIKLGTEKLHDSHILTLFRDIIER